MERPETIKMLIRVPLALKRWIEAQAARNVSPLSSEVIRILRDRMDTDLAKTAARDAGAAA